MIRSNQAVAGLLLTFALPSPGRTQQQGSMEDLRRLAQPGEEHRLLQALAGRWRVTVSLPDVTVVSQATDSADATASMDGRYLDVRIRIAQGPLAGDYRNILGFDRRHGVFTNILFDTHGTYFVTARGGRTTEGFIRMHGSDDDPTFARMGIEKRFVFDLILPPTEAAADPRWSLTTQYVDTRTAAGTLRPFVTFTFSRSRGSDGD